MRLAALFVLLCASCRAIDLSTFGQEFDLSRLGVVQTCETDFEAWDPRRGEAYVLLQAGNPQDREPKSLKIRIRAAEISIEGVSSIVFDHTIERICPWVQNNFVGILDVEGRRFHWTVVVLEAHPDLPTCTLFFEGRGDEYFDHLWPASKTTRSR